MKRTLATVLALAGLLLAAPAAAEPGWPARLESRLAAIEEAFDGELGVHVRPLAPGAPRVGWRDTEPWYLASLVKVPVAIELMARVEAGELTLDQRLVLRESDYVDGAGPTNWAEPGTPLRLGDLLVAMLTVSDNTATDMLIEHLGLEAINRRAASLVGEPQRLGPITPLVEVRRQVYGALHPAARELTGLDFIELQKQPDDARRLAWLARRLEVPQRALRLPSLDAAFARYYAGGLNGGGLDVFADLLAALAQGQALGAQAGADLLAIMTATASGEPRLKAGFGPGIRFAHKTGTQHRLACDAGIASAVGEGRQLVVVACVRGEPEVARSERALAEIGRAIRESGLLLEP
ncbi:serine hydrolase [Halomonas campisalis]|uniref:Serine hydrolase n=1 Tax=Billgrantia campisalis TaxID=74661 RepID=A0ABS9P855_9GAMM|nr:serine hydrolase [Halomonas campisalis]MCG6657968.1 serine hydrolase [Halomonas campisalis]MDR5863507.1 class A beta-lactamase-related serine hydrolase [Halomonas campisalis]